jgi:hypothetical protein
MALASLWMTDGSFRRIEPTQAIDIWLALNGHTEPTEAQAVFLPHVKDVFIPPSYRDQATGYNEAHKLVAEPGPDRSHMLHTGIEQGRTQQLPVGDR